MSFSTKYEVDWMVPKVSSILNIVESKGLMSV